jgi:hypothetical protein
MAETSGAKPTRAPRSKSNLVHRAASLRERGTLSLDQQTQRRFLMVVALIVIGGIVLIGSIRSERQYAHPTVFDSWQNAYSVFDCETETWLPPIEAQTGANGIRTRADGIIYIEPLDDSATGSNAELSVFLNNVGAVLTDEELVLPDGTTLSENNLECRDEEVELQVMRWDDVNAEEPIEVRTSDLASTPFLADGQALAIVLAPRGASIPIPPSAALLPDVLPSSLTGSAEG